MTESESFDDSNNEEPNLEETNKEEPNLGNFTNGISRLEISKIIEDSVKSAFAYKYLGKLQKNPPFFTT